MNKIKEIIRPLIIDYGKKIENKKFNKCPIILGACPRSGTTLLLSILSAHPHIHSIKNQTYAFAKWNKKGKAERLDRLYRELIFHKISENSTRWCEKTPKNVEFFGEILDYFQEVKLIHLIRDGRDVVTSKHPYRDPNKFWVSPERWVNNVKSALEYRDNEKVYTLFYEKLIENYQEEIDKLCHFLDEETHPNLSKWQEKASLRKSKHWRKSVQKLHRRSIGRWKNEKYKKRIVEFYSNSESLQLLKDLNYI